MLASKNCFETNFLSGRLYNMKPETHYFQADEHIPNNPDLPVLIYRHAAESSDLALYFEEMLARHGWGGLWRDGVYDYTHFHSKSHEVLCIAAGHARLQIGGEHGGDFDVSTGDLIVLPAGTGHRQLSASHDFLVVGAYPKGQEDYDILCSVKDDPKAVERIAELPLPGKDPLTGQASPMHDFWQG